MPSTQPTDPSEDDATVLWKQPGKAADYTDSDAPVVIIPRGGTREVGRSCYQLQTQYGEYLIDCGLKQGSGTGNGVSFPDFRGIGSNDLDAVFLTHAHIDHIGGLPILEHKNKLSRDAPIVCTRPTGALAHQLLHDSLKIHKENAEKPGREQRFTEGDVREVLSRFEPISYGEYTLSEFTDIEGEHLNLQFGDAGHLLGSAWITVETVGRRILFSGDLGGRSQHLRDIQAPPSVDTLFLESTYGNRTNHNSFSDACNTLVEEAIDAARLGIPVLIPSFAVGRAQEIMQAFKRRLQQFPDDEIADIEIVYDGMATEATDIYHAYSVGQYVTESINKHRANAGDSEPFTPECAWRPSKPDDRYEIFDGESAPIVIAPSGMLTGGLSPAYLLEMVKNYEEGRVIFTGYQAEETLGRELLEASGDTAELQVSTRPLTNIDDVDDGSDVRSSETDAGYTINVPTNWVRSVSLSGHAAANRLLEFARDADPTHITLVHGSSDAQEKFRPFLVDNTDANLVSATRIGYPIPANPRLVTDENADQGQSSNEDSTGRYELETHPDTLEERVAALEEIVDTLTDDLAALRNARKIEEDETDNG